MKKAISLFLILCISTVLLSACSPSIPTSDQYVEGQDCQYMYNGQGRFRICSTGDSYYYLAPSGTIYIIDKQTLTCVPFCNKPNCAHNSKECIAHAKPRGIWFYQGSLYVVDERGDEQAEVNELESNILYKLSLDGTSKDFVRYVPSSGSSFIHRGYYYANHYDGVYRYSLTDKEEGELIIERTEDAEPILRNIYGNSLYVHVTRFESQPAIEELRYDISDLSSPVTTGYIEVKEDKTEAVLSQCITPEGIFAKKVLSDNQATTIYDSTFLWADYNGNEREDVGFLVNDVDTSVMSGMATADSSYYYYFAEPGVPVERERFEQSVLLIYDRKTKEKCEEIPFYTEYGSLFAPYLGDDRYLFMEFETRHYYDENKQYVREPDSYMSLCILDKQQIGKGAEIRELVRGTQ